MHEIELLEYRTLMLRDLSNAIGSDSPRCTIRVLFIQNTTPAMHSPISLLTHSPWIALSSSRLSQYNQGSGVGGLLTNKSREKETVPDPHYPRAIPPLSST